MAAGRLLGTEGAVAYGEFDWVDIAAFPEDGRSVDLATAVETTEPELVHTVSSPESARPTMDIEAAGMEAELDWVGIVAGLGAVGSWMSLEAVPRMTERDSVRTLVSPVDRRSATIVLHWYNLAMWERSGMKEAVGSTLIDSIREEHRWPVALASMAVVVDTAVDRPKMITEPG